MAKIMGLELKAVKTFIGSDGYGLNANLYYKDKKVAFVLDEGNGGELMVYFADKDKQEKVLAVANRYYEKYPKYLFHDTDWTKLTELVEELYDLYETEKYFKKSLKKGFSVVVEIRYCKRMDNPLDNYDPAKQDCMVALKTWNEKVKQDILNEYQPAEIKVYERLEDFIIE